MNFRRIMNRFNLVQQYFKNTHHVRRKIILVIMWPVLISIFIIQKYLENGGDYLGIVLVPFAVNIITIFITLFLIDILYKKYKEEYSKTREQDIASYRQHLNNFLKYLLEQTNELTNMNKPELLTKTKELIKMLEVECFEDEILDEILFNLKRVRDKLEKDLEEKIVE